MKGTSLKFQSNIDGGPCTKYEALFDSRPQFDYMRIGFLSEIGGWNLQDLEERVHELASCKSLPNDDAETCLRCYISQCREYFADEGSATSPPPNFAQQAWPLLVQCICEEDEEQQYFLSANELLLVSELSKQNTVIFATANGSAVFIGSVVGHEKSDTVLVALQRGDADFTYRTHFQRLVFMEDVQEAEKNNTAAAGA